MSKHPGAVAAYNSGRTIEAVAQAFSVPLITMYDHLKRKGVEFRVSGPVLLEVDCGQVINMRKAGHTWDHISTLLGPSPKTLRARLKSRGFLFQKKYSEEQVECLRALEAGKGAGLTLADLKANPAHDRDWAKHLLQKQKSKGRD